MSAIKQWAIFRDGADGVLYIREIGTKFSEREVAVCYSTPIEDVELLAAAPELYAALGAIYPLMGAILSPPENEDDDIADQWRLAMNMALVALKKVRGEVSISQEAKQ